MNKACVYPNNTESVDEVLQSLAIRQNDMVGYKFMKYKGIVPDIYRDLNLYALKYTRRFFTPVDKRTNSVIMPDNFLMLSSVSYVDECNKIHLAARNGQLNDDIIDMSLDHDCHCECGCKSNLCGQIKSYEAIVSDSEEEMPDASFQMFTSITRKRMDADGKFVIERTFPVRVYTANVWTGVELKTEIEELCRLDVLPCGCVINTEANICKVNECCNADTFPIECGDSRCEAPTIVGYNLNETGNRIIFPGSFGFTKALIRYYYEPDPRDIRIPLVAKPAFMAGLYNEDIKYDDKQPMWRMREFQKNYDKEKDKLFTLLNRFSLKDVNAILNPYRRMP